MLVVAWGYQPEPLHKPLNRASASQSLASGFQVGIFPEQMLAGPGRSFKVFSDLVSEIPKHHFCHILLVKQVTKANPDRRGEKLDSASCWWRVRITSEESTRDANYHCSYLWAYDLLQRSWTL